MKSVCRLDAQHRLIIAAVVAIAVFFGLRRHMAISSDVIAVWDVFAFVMLALAWVTILMTPQTKIRERARLQDVGRNAIFVFCVAAACAALFGVGFLIRSHKQEIQTHFTLHLVLALSSVIFSWSLMQTVFGLHYAHSFYGDSTEPGASQHGGGLLFPGDRPPDYFDFAYFSFVIGMTCQVSDVQITSRRMRRLTLMHSILAFGFNTLILALLINTVSGLL